MRIVSVNLNGDLLDFGLKPLAMDRLGPVVALVGPNGSGKSRALNLVQKRLAEFEPPPAAMSWEEQAAFPAHSGSFSALFRSTQPRHQLALRRAFRFDQPVEQCSSLTFCPRSSPLAAPEHFGDHTLASAYNGLSESLANLPEVALLAVKHVFDLQTRITSPHRRKTKPESAESIANDIAALEAVIAALLGTKVDVDESGNVFLFDRHTTKDTHSAGQLILIQLAVALWKQGSRLDGELIFLDEPEVHLHPKVLIEVIDRLRAANPTGQLWIATHSIPLIAHLANTDPNCLWYVENGSVSNAGSQPERVLRGLLGDDEKIAQIGDFLREPAVFAGTRFAAECLRPPGIAGAAEHDPQNNQIAKVVGALRDKRQGTVRLLDYGAGRGRLLAGLREDAELANQVEYFAFDLELHADLTAMVEHEKLFTTHSGFTTLGSTKMDVIVLCNVLHEIEPSKWKSLLHKLHSILADDGYLLIVEDDRMPVGEKAHRFGFVVLPEAGVRMLFRIEPGEEFKCSDGHPESPGRLNAFLVPAEALGRVDEASVRAALKRTKECRIEELEKLREKKSPTARDGRIHALLAQQLANIVLLEEH